METQNHKLTLSAPDKSELVLATRTVDPGRGKPLTNAVKYTNECGKIALTLEPDKDKVRITFETPGPV